MSNPTFSIDMLYQIDRDLLKTCENALLHWAIICPTDGSAVWIVVSTFSCGYTAKEVVRGKDCLIVFSMQNRCWEMANA